MADSEIPADAPKRMTCALVAIFLGGLGVHKFMLGHTMEGVILIASNCLCLGGLIGLIEGIIYITKTDEEFYQTYVVEKKKWF